MHNFQLKLLRTETSRANEDRKRYEEMLRKARSLMQKEIDCNIRPNTTQRRSVEKVAINDWQASVT